MKKLILASASPRRQELLRQIGLQFEVRVKSVDETLPQEAIITEAVSELAYRKAIGVAGSLTEGIVIGADTIVVYRKEILGKPDNRVEAIKTLRKLSGNQHLVITGFCVMDAATGKTVKASETTRVFFRQLSESEIEAYVNSGEPFDKAGAYGIQGLGAILVEKIEGCYFNVVGLPLTKLFLVLKEFGVKLLE